VNELNDITKEQQSQAQRVIEQIINKLPQNMDETAKKYKAIERRKEIKSAEKMLVAFFGYAISGISQKILSVCASLIEAGHVSDRVWQKKIVKSVPWLMYLMSKELFRNPLFNRTNFMPVMNDSIIYTLFV